MFKKNIRRVWNQIGASILLLFLSLSISFAQKISHPLVLDNSIKKINSKSEVRVLAVMVQFKTDKDTLTSGNGNFDLSDKYKDTTVDAPPHNRQYFLSHLKFMKNYFTKVSDSKLNVTYYIPDKVYTLPDSMRKYSPGSKNDYAKLANFTVDTWTLVDKQSPEIDFSQYDCFFIFHAGSGKDIDLASIYGSDPTPYDLPSITFNNSSYLKYLGSSFSGISVDSGKVKINNSAVIPESEYRELTSYGVTNLVELSINGIMVSSLAGYLGLPDLFNTKNGTTAIGRFGLMDGQAIFSYNGLFPPEPSAWEKIQLGWVTPITVPNGLSELSISAHRTDGVASNYQVYKVPISNREYFLLECRYRDPGNDGLKITSEIRGVQKQYSIKADSSYYFDQFGSVPMVNGVVTDVDDIDWSVPGGMDYKKNKLYGGILIWHIDENIIESGFANNSINNDPDHRGIDVEEADGAQDIGQSYGTLQSASGSENGQALDFWYNDLGYYNKDSLLRPVYKNYFSPLSIPNSNSYYGGNSHITIYDFSTSSANMTFKVKIGDEAVTPLRGFPVKVDTGSGLMLSNADLKGSNSQQLLVNTKNVLKIFDTEGNELSGSNLNQVKSFAVFKETNKTDKLVLGKSNNNIEIYDFANSLSKLFEYKIPGSSTDSLQVYSLTSGAKASNRINVLNKSNGILNHFSYSNSAFSYSGSDTINNLKPVDLITGYENSSSVKDLDYFSISGGSIYTNKTSWMPLSQNEKIKNFAVSKAHPESVLDFAVLVYNSNTESLTLKFNPLVRTGICDNPGTCKDITSASTKTILNNVCNNCWDNLSPVVVGDIDNDKYSDIVFTIYNKLFAFNVYGVSIDNYPVIFKNSVSKIKPVIADINGDSRNEIVVCSEDGSIYAYNEKGKLVNGFPVSIGSKPAVTPVFFKVRDSLGLAVINSEGYLYAWKLSGKFNSDKIAWSGEFANERMSGSQNETKSELTFKSSEFLPKSRAYNYPNPVYGKSTKIRYFLSKSSNVKIKIFDLSGESVKDFSTTGIGGMDNEVEWDVSNVQSGVYLAHIEADSGSENSSVIIKIAVIK